MTPGLCPTTGKIQYPSASHARATMHRVHERIPRRRRRLAPTALPFITYRCDHCGAWHISSRPRRKDGIRKFTTDATRAGGGAA